MSCVCAGDAVAGPVVYAMLARFLVETASEGQEPGFGSSDDLLAMSALPMRLPLWPSAA